MPICADEIEGLDNAIKEYLKQCILNLDVQPSSESLSALKLTVNIEAPLTKECFEGGVLLEGSVVLDTGEESREDVILE